MKNKFFAAVLMLCMIFSISLPVSAVTYDEVDIVNDVDVTYVNDWADILSDTEEKSLNEKAESISEKYKCNIYIFTVNDYSEHGSTPRDAAENMHKVYNLGYGNDKDTNLLMLSMSERDYANIAYGDFANKTFTDYARDEYIKPKFLDDFKDDDWYSGFSDYLDACETALKMSVDGEPLESDNDPDDFLMKIIIKIAIVIIVPTVIALIVCLIFKAQMKSVRQKNEAREYIVRGSQKMFVSQDMFTHTTTTRRKIEHSSSSSGGGGTSVNSGGYSGSSGKF